MKKMSHKEKIGLIIFVIFMSFASIMAIIEPEFSKEEIHITIFDTSREKYNDYPNSKDKVVTAYTDSEKYAFISISFDASSSYMKKLDRTRKSKVEDILFNLIKDIENPFYLPISVEVSNSKTKPEKEITYRMHFDYTYYEDYDRYVLGRDGHVKREVKYDRPLG